MHESTGSYCCHLDIGVGMGAYFKVLDKVFYVMGKMLSGKLSCAWTGRIFIMSPILCEPSHKIMPYCRCEQVRFGSAFPFAH